MDDYTKETEDPAANQKQEAKREIIEFFKLVFYFLILFIGLRWYVIEGYEVQGPSMEPTLKNGERILVFKLPHILSQFSLFSGLEPFEERDIVVFESPDDPDKRYVKRVVAKGPRKEVGNTVAAKSHDDLEPEGESVHVQFDKGRVYVNNHLVVEDDYILPEENRHIDSFEHEEVVLEPGEYYVLGDYRDVSKDSRIFGPINDEKVIGRAVLRFWPLSKFGLLK